jgi:putative phage-type endonuclease
VLTEKQLTARRAGIGGSDAPAVCGVDQYRQPLDVYLEKTGESDPEDLSDKESVQWGNLMEDLVAREWARRSGLSVRRSNMTMVHPDFNFMLGHIDRKIVGRREGLEIKTRGVFAASDYGRDGTDEVRDSDLVQCAHYMSVTGWDAWNMAVLVGGQELRTFRIPRNENMIESILEAEFLFWDRVKRLVPPDLEFTHRSTERLLGKLYPGTNGQRVMLPIDALALKAELDDENAKASAAQKRAKELRLRLRDMIGNNAVGMLPDGSGGWTRKLIQRARYTVEPKEYWDVRYSKKLGGES